ncbi:hypothetical protein [Flavobacterium chungangense]|uniref:Uncharacterized protein n=1 Tax=Flavobacterium chungangense TaxID=554283 RepID=A0A6V6YSR4_9FLAO|nr:hypothetical protein [Flavobacterium chungangense]CAD0002446.1 hypothetical protein FLACHUCJ7_00966 [Flavobacterium chungangense]
MKIIIVLIFTAISFLANCQSKPTVPNLPKINKSETKTKSSSSSVSVQNSDSSYSFKATFDSDKNDKVKRMLMDHLDEKYLIAKGEVLIWKKMDADEIVYSVTFKNGSLRMHVDKELSSGNAVREFEKLGNKLRETISND